MRDKILTGTLIVGVFVSTMLASYMYGRENAPQERLISYRFVLLEDWKYHKLNGVRMVTNKEVLIDSLLLNGLLDELKVERRRDVLVIRGK